MLVAFNGEGSGIEHLTWGQRNIWKMMVDFDSAVMVGGTMPLPEGTTLDHIVNLLKFVASRHESMRTRIELAADGTPMQRLYDSGEIPLEIIDLEPGEDAVEVGEAVRDRFD